MVGRETIRRNKSSEEPVKQPGGRRSDTAKGRPQSTRRYLLRPVGHVESRLVDRANAPSQGDEGAPQAWLVFNPDVRDAVRDLQVGDHIIVITWLHLSRRDVLRTYPRNLTHAPHVGVFSLRSPDRPNPIGLHPVQILGVSGLRIKVDHLEAVNGSPILDIKPVI
jgi:tRNA-Thr(GGU) m(6)t(6)A37 methyltransferase TsaA